MKVYILTMCCGEGNYTPFAFNSLEDAKKVLKESYDYEVENCGDSIFKSDCYDESYSIVYDDDTFLEATIYDVEVK